MDSLGTVPAVEVASRRPARRIAAPQLDSLTGLRGLAAIMVFCFHFNTFQMVFGPHGGLVFASLPRPRYLTESGNFAVSSFFILSGFVLAFTTREGTTMANFCAKRIGKLCPVYLVTSVLAIVAILLIGMPITFQNIVLHLTMLQSWFPFQDIYHGVNPVTWSLSTEAFFYVLFPLALFLVRRLSSRALWWLFGAAMVLEFTLPLYVSSFFSVNTAGHQTYINTAANGGDVAYWFTLTFPPYRFLEFLVGMIGCVLMTRGSLPRIRLRWAWLLCGAGYAVGTFLPGPLQRTAFGLIPLAVLVVALAQADLAGDRSPLRRWLFVELGKLSYGMYAIQLLIFLPTYPFVLRWVSSALSVPEATLHQPLWKIAAMVGYFAVIIGASLPLHRLVEVPCYDFAKRLFRSGQGSPLFAAAQPVGEPE